MDIVQIERVLTQFWADKLGLTVDTNIFRGGIPSGVKISGAFGVRIDNEITPNNPSLRQFNAVIIGKFADRDSALSMLERANSVLPCYGISVTALNVETPFQAILRRGNGGVYQADDNGKVKHFFALNILLHVAY